MLYNHGHEKKIFFIMNQLNSYLEIKLSWSASIYENNDSTYLLSEWPKRTRKLFSSVFRITPSSIVSIIANNSSIFPTVKSSFLSVITQTNSPKSITPDSLKSISPKIAYILWCYYEGKKFWSSSREIIPLLVTSRALNIFVIFLKFF